MNKIFISNIGDLAESQKASFYRFLAKGIGEELANFPNPFLSKIKINARKKIACLVYLYPEDIKLKGPNFNIETCLRRDMTYSIQLYVPGEYSYTLDPKIETLDSNKKTKEVRVKQDIFFGEIPLMTEEGTFIISGCERIIISQIIRSPGIYFRKEFNNTRKAIYTATIISNRGVWTKILLDQCDPKKSKPEDINKDRIYIKLNDFKPKSSEKESEIDNNKINIYDVIRYFGLNFDEISDSLKYPLYLTNQQFNNTGLINTKQETKTELDTNLLIKKLFFNQRSGCFSIGEIGRYKINKKLGLNLPKDITYLTAHDFIGIIDGLMELKYHDRVSDDIDDIKNKQIRCIGELLQNQIRIGLYRLQKSLIEETPISNTQKLSFDLETYSNPEDWIIDPRPLTSSIKEFFKTYKNLEQDKWSQVEDWYDYDDAIELLKNTHEKYKQN